MDRRSFLRNTLAGAVTAAAQPAGAAPAKAQPASAAPAAAQPAGAAPAAAKTIGIQVGAVSFVDEGVEKVLDVFQRDASINTLFVATFTYGRGIAGRQLPGQPLPNCASTPSRHPLQYQ